MKAFMCFFNFSSCIRCFDSTNNMGNNDNCNVYPTLKEFTVEPYEYIVM